MKNYTSTIKTQRSQSVAERQLSRMIESRYNFLVREAELEDKYNEDIYRIKDRFYNVLVKCGHTGQKTYTLVNFAIKAKSGVEAAKKARNMPRAKHENIDVIRGLKEISEEEYNELYLENRRNEYLKATCVQEQRICEMNGLKIYPEENVLLQNEQKYWDRNYTRQNKVEYIKKRNKIKKNSYNDYFDIEF